MNSNIQAFHIWKNFASVANYRLQYKWCHPSTRAVGVPSLWYYSRLRLTTVCTSLLHFNKRWQTQHDEFILRPNDIFTYFPNNEIIKTSADKRHVARQLPTSGRDSVRWICSSGMTTILDVDYDQQSPDSGKRVRPTTWQSGTAIHCHQISCRPHQQFCLQRPHATCTLHQERYFKSVDMFGCSVTRRCLSWLDTCSLLSTGNTLTAHICNTVCELHAAQTVTLKVFCVF